MLRGIVSVAVVLGLSIAAQAAVTASFTSSPTPSPFSGYTTYIVNLTSDSGDMFGFDIDFDGSMIQGTFPYGVFLPVAPSNPLLDSCFLFTESGLNVAVSSESGTSLTAAFAFDAMVHIPIPTVAIAQLVIADGNTVSMTGSVMIGIDEVDFAEFTIPEPATISLLAIGGIALLRRRSAQVLRRRSR